ncbi:MAG: hypothetical protein JW938_04700, partial [Candidatus Omnitrophica bacterium]|nr:hypothetical protein [Candidatus Omnitrophota bacterium]
RETIVKRRKVIRLLCDIGIDMKPSDVNTLFQTDDKNNPVFNILHMRTDELTRFKNVINDMIHNEGIPLTQAIKKDMETGGLNVRYPVMKSHLDALKAKDNQKPEQPEARNDEPRVKTERTHQNGVKTIVRPLPGMIKQPSINQSKTGDRPHEKARSEAPAPVIKKPPAATARYPHGVDTQKPLLKRPDAEAEPSPEYRAEKDWKKLIMQFPFKNGARETVVFAIMQAEEEEWVRKREDKNQAIIEIKELLSRAEKALPGEGNILSGIWYELYFKCVSFYQNEGKTDLTIDDLDEINNELRFIFAYHKWFRQAAQHNIKKIVNGVAENRSPQILRYSLLELSAEKNLEPNPVFILSDEEVHAMAHNYETSGRMVVLGIWEELKRGVYYKHEIKDNVLDGKGSEYHKKFEPMYERLYAKAREKRDEEINAMDTFQKLLTVELGADEVERRDTGSVIREIFIVKAA